MGSRKNPQRFSWVSIIDIVYAFVLVGLPFLVLTRRIEGVQALLSAVAWAVLNYLYFRFRMQFDSGAMKLVVIIIAIVALGMLCILFASDTWDWLAVRIGWFPTMLVFLAVIGLLAVGLLFFVTLFISSSCRRPEGSSHAGQKRSIQGLPKEEIWCRK